MKKLYKLFCALSIFVLACSIHSFSQTATYSFIYTGAVQTWTVPVGVTSVIVDARGARGGFNAEEGITMSDRPGYGACVTTTLTVTPGQILDVYVGGEGANGITSAGGAGGYNGGGNGSLGYSPYAGGGGGGASDVRISPYSLADRVVIAAGGGGAGGDYFLPDVDYDRGGDGGGTTGEAGFHGGTTTSTMGGGGGTPTLGGSPGVYSGWGTGTSGGPGVGGTAGSPSGGGGGGGGLYGGGGGSWGGGGGGSSYTDASLAPIAIHTRGCDTGAGYVAITVTCVPPTGGIIEGPATVCQGTPVMFYDTTGTTGGRWTSSDTLVATVDSITGAVTGILPYGTFTLTYSIVLSCGSASATSTTIVVLPSPAGISGPDSVCVGSSITLTDITTGGVWSSTLPFIGDVDTAGNVSGSSVGTTVISYTKTGCAATKVVTVNPLPAPITGPTTVCKFLTITLADATPGGTWSSTITGAATINSTSGVVTGVASGATAIIYTTRFGCTVFQIVNITIPPLPITGPNQVCVGDAITLAELVGGGTWGTSSGAAAPVSPFGTVTGLLPGSVTISYTTLACPPVFYPVTINPIPDIITGPMAICTGGYTTSLADATPGGIWGSSNPDVLISPTGVVTSSAAGESSVITYTLPTSCYVSAVVNVSVPPTPITGLDSICKNTSTTMSNATPGGLWASTNLAIAQVVDTSGFVTGVDDGTVTISYLLTTGCYALKTLTVNPLISGSVTTTSAPTGIICEGTPVTLTALPVNGGTPTIIWKIFSATRYITDTGLVFIDTAIHGDVVDVFMIPHNVCALHDTVGDTVALNIYPNDVAPIVRITTPNDTVVSNIGDVVTFFSNVTWGGMSPTYQWYVNRTLIPGATNDSYSAAVYYNDTFTCQVIGDPPCDTIPTAPGVSNKIIIYADYLGVQRVAGTNDLNLFPNPNNGNFTLSGTLSASTNKEVTYEVVDMLGRVLNTGTTQPKNGTIDQQINLANIAEGAYLLRVQTETRSETFHFVISK